MVEELSEVSSSEVVFFDDLSSCLRTNLNDQITPIIGSSIQSM